MTNITLFSQIISKLDWFSFSKLVCVHQTDKHQKGYTSWTHLVAMLFCQFAKSQSVRDISNGLRSATGNPNHLGIIDFTGTFSEYVDPATGQNQGIDRKKPVDMYHRAA